MRTAAMLHQTPAAILGELNAALHTEAQATNTCTAVYGQIDMSAATICITLAVGGHPAPLVVRAGGSVETTPAHGTILGAVEHPVFHTCELRLDQGDALVVYSDGVIESRSDATLGPATLAGELDGTTSASHMVDRLVSLATGSGPLPDDVTVLVLRCMDER